MEGEGCVDQVGVYDEPGATLAMGCYLGTPGNGNPNGDILAWLIPKDLLVLRFIGKPYVPLALYGAGRLDYLVGYYHYC